VLAERPAVPTLDRQVDVDRVITVAYSAPAIWF
jgi:hypothetical protein